MTDSQKMIKNMAIGAMLSSLIFAIGWFTTKPKEKIFDPNPTIGYKKLVAKDTTQVQQYINNLIAKSFINLENLFSSNCLVDIKAIKQQIINLNYTNVEGIRVCNSMITNAPTYNISNRLIINKLLDNNGVVISNPSYLNYLSQPETDLCPKNCDVYFASNISNVPISASIPTATAHTYQRNLNSYIDLHTDNNNKVTNIKSVVINNNLFPIFKNCDYVKIYFGNTGKKDVAFLLGFRANANGIQYPNFANYFYLITDINLCPRNCDVYN
jgi:hypothetical protein